jgi:pimeloyl-ACP methyl ester carboxylesterase
MHTPLAIMATVLTVLALCVPAQTRPFTRVMVDGRSIRMLLAGGGDATVVFENGAGAPLETWGKVQPDVSRFARTVSYDRAGVGLSDDGPLPRDGRRIATELRRALLSAGVAPPYILVGASIGGPYIRVFAGMYPEDVAGMVLVDPTVFSGQVDAAGVPALEGRPAALEQARASRVPSGIPLFLIDAVSPEEVPFATEAIRALRRNNRPEIEADSQEYRRWLEAIPGSRLIVTHRSGHNVPIEQPELVVETIRHAVDERRQSKAAAQAGQRSPREP